MLSLHSRNVLSTPDTANYLTLLSLEFFHTAVQSYDIENILSHSTLSSNRLCVARFSATLHDLWSRTLRISRLLGLYGLPSCPFFRKGGNNTNKNVCSLRNFSNVTHVFDELMKFSFYHCIPIIATLLNT